MEITPNIADGIINNSKEAQKIFFENTKKFISFKPFVINFHKDDNDFVSSICWKGFDQINKKEAILSAIEIPQNILKSCKETKFIPLNIGDTVMLHGKIFTIEEKNSELFIMELPYICSGKYAESIVNVTNNIKNLFWRLGMGLKDSTPVCTIWIGINLENVDKSMMLPVFSKDKANLAIIDDIDIMDTNSIIRINDCIYHYYHDNEAKLEFLSPMIEGLFC